MGTPIGEHSLEFLERQLDGVPLTSEMLMKLLNQELERKEMLEKKALELKKVTRVEIKDRTVELGQNLRTGLLEANKRRVAMNKITKASLPSQIDHPGTYRRLENIEDLEKTEAYVSVCHFIKFVSENIQKCLLDDLNTEAVNYLQELQTLQAVHLEYTECSNLLTYCSKLVTSWENQLAARFSKDFEKCLDKLGWPGSDLTFPSADLVEHFHSIIRCLTRVSCSKSEERVKQLKETPSLLIDFKEPMLVIQLLTKPLIKRFRFHFCSSRATSDDYKPEWYFSQVKHWIRDLLPFVKTHLEPITTVEAERSSVVEFIQSLSEILILKTNSLLTSNLISDTLFSKLLEESIRYESETSGLWTDSITAEAESPPSFVNLIFSQPHVLNRWLSIERKACLDKLDELFSSPTAWKRAFVPGPAEIGDLFVLMLKFVVDRFSHLKQPGQKLQFLELLLEVLEDYRIRSLQIWKTSVASPTNYCSDGKPIDFVIADTLRFIQISVTNWEDEPFFTSLAYFYGTLEAAEKKEAEALKRSPGKSRHYSRDDPSLFTFSLKSLPLLPDLGDDQDMRPKLRPSSDRLFAEVQATYNILAGTILSQWCDSIVHEFKITLSQQGYLKKKWHNHEDFPKPGTAQSPQIVLAIRNLRAAVDLLYDGMDSSLAEEWMEALAVKLDKMLMEELIWPNKFTDNSTIQVQFDLLESLFPVFSDRRVKPSHFFSNINCVLRVWEMPLGDAMLLCETLQDNQLSYREQEEALIEAELAFMTCSEVVKLLRARIDLN